MQRVRFFYWILTAIIIALASCRSVGDVDIFTQIRLGDEILKIGAFPKAEFLSYQLTGTIATTGWLAQIIAALIYKLGGLHALVYATAIAFGCACSIAAVLRLDRDQTANYGSLCSLVLTFSVIVTSIAVRPQAIAALCFVLIYWLALTEISLIVRIATTVLISLIWQNAHPSLAMGCLLVFLLSLGYFLSDRRSKKWRELFLMILVMAAFQFATPDGLQGLSLGARNYHISRELLGVSEWMPLWDEKVRSAMIMAWIAVVLSFLLAVFGRSKISLREVIILLPFLLLAVFSARFVLFFALAAAPIWSRLIDSNLHFKNGSMINAWLVKGAIPAGIVILLLPLLRDPLQEDNLPISGIEELKANVPSGRIYNYREWGGPLELFGSPNWQVAIDGRLYLYSEEQWQEYEMAAEGKIDLDKIVSEHRPDAFFLNRNYQSGLISLLEKSKDWRLAIKDGTTVGFLKN